MSKAFTKDDGWEEPVVPPRAPLPAGVPNYVTPRGLELLRAELAELEGERQRLGSDTGDEVERRRRAAILTRLLGDLAARIATAQVVDPRRQVQGKVRFGARVTLKTLTGAHAGEQRHLTIVGVDEADAATGRVAFIAPIARAVLGREVGETTTLVTGRGEEVLQVTSIEYPTE